MLEATLLCGQAKGRSNQGADRRNLQAQARILTLNPQRSNFPNPGSCNAERTNRTLSCLALYWSKVADGRAVLVPRPAFSIGVGIEFCD